MGRMHVLLFDPGLSPHNKEMSKVHCGAAGEQTQESLAQLQPEK